jgi:hypothetical protein
MELLPQSEQTSLEPDTHIPLDEHLYLMRSVRRMVWTFTIAFVAILAVGVFNVWYTNHVNSERIKAQQAQSAQSHGVICSVVQAQITAFREAPPVTAAGKSAADSWADLGKLLKCKEEK